MVLSERERRLLQEMETHLLAEDPALASSLSLRRLRPGVRAVLGTSGLVLGVLVMAVGLLRGHAVGIGVALVGYLFLLAGTTITADLMRAGRERRPRVQPEARRAS